MLYDKVAALLVQHRVATPVEALKHPQAVLNKLTNGGFSVHEASFLLAALKTVRGGSPPPVAGGMILAGLDIPTYKKA